MLSMALLLLLLISSRRVGSTPQTGLGDEHPPVALLQQAPPACSGHGNCFNISGARNSAPKLPSGTNLNGVYFKTAHNCSNMPVYQKGGSDGPVLYLDEVSNWDVGPSERMDCSYGYYLYSGSSSCTASPVGAGCAGKWWEYDSSGTFQANPSLRVATTAAAPPPPPTGGARSIEKLGAYVMQAAETSPVNWNGRTLLVETVSGNTPGVYGCCSCTTFGCVANASAHTGYSDCSACTCSAERKAAVGSCAPEFFRIRDANTLAILVSPVPGTEGFAFASAFVADNRLWVYGTNRVNKTVAKKSTSISCFSTADPTSATAAWRVREALVLPAGYSAYNTDVAAVEGAARKFIMSIETNVLAGKPTKSWAVFFAETAATEPDAGWTLVEPTANTVDLSRMTACPAVRFFGGWYYVATTTRGPLCPAAVSHRHSHRLSEPNKYSESDHLMYMYTPPMLTEVCL